MTQTAAMPLPTVPRSAYQPGGAEIFQRMSALAVASGSVNFAQGIPEPVYDGLWTEAITRAAGQSTYQYVPSVGLPRLVESVAAMHGVSADDVVITSGCTESLTAALQSLAGRGYERVAWTEPYYSFYPGMAAAAGLTAQCVPMKDEGHRFAFDTCLMESVMEQPGRTVLLANSPHNPTGAMLGPSDWERLVAAAERTDSMILLDDAYRSFSYDGAPPRYADLVQSGRVAVAGSISKSLAAAGNRVGWMLLPRSVKDLADDAHMHMSYCVPAFMQHATADVLDQVMPALVDARRAVLMARRLSLVEALREVGADVRMPAGGFFVTAALPGGVTSGATNGEDLVRHLTASAGITPLPLDSFCVTAPEKLWLRWSFTLPDEAFERGCHAIRNLTVG